VLQRVIIGFAAAAGQFATSANRLRSALDACIDLYKH